MAQICDDNALVSPRLLAPLDSFPLVTSGNLLTLLYVTKAIKGNLITFDELILGLVQLHSSPAASCVMEGFQLCHIVKKPLARETTPSSHVLVHFCQPNDVDG